MVYTITCHRAFLSYGPDGLPLARGIRVPLIVISPYARVHAVSHVEGDHNAVIETINAIFGLPALANLPDEAQALAAGRAPPFNGPNGVVQNYLGPRDINSAVTGDLLSAFDPKRLLGLEPLLPSSYASIAEAVNSFPHYGAGGCATLGIVTEERRQGMRTPSRPVLILCPRPIPTTIRNGLWGHAPCDCDRSFLRFPSMADKGVGQ